MESAEAQVRAAIVTALEARPKPRGAMELFRWHRDIDAIRNGEKVDNASPAWEACEQALRDLRIYGPDARGVRNALFLKPRSFR